MQEKRRIKEENRRLNEGKDMAQHEEMSGSTK
jgi:hypothetical protein